MKIKDGYLLKSVAGNQIVVPVGDLNFDGLISLNESGALLWRTMEHECTKEDLICALTEVYDISEEIANADVSAFLLRLQNAGLLDE